MSSPHWKDQDFINHVYGIGPDDGHLETCAECRDRWTAILATRRSITREPEIPRELFAEQRRNIYRRLGREPGAGPTRFVPAFAAVVLLLIGFLVVERKPTAGVPSPSSVSDAQLFSDIYALEQTSEPSVAKPMRALFQEN